MQITKFSIRPAPEPNDRGFTTLAVFDVCDDRIRIVGCTLARYPDGRHNVWGPKGSRGSTVTMSDTLRTDLTTRALASYQALTAAGIADAA